MWDLGLLPKIYLAGKIHNQGWRHKIVSGLDLQDWDKGELIQNDFIYVGPFFVNCNHGCYSAESSHLSTTGCSPDRDLSRKETAQLCREAVQKADLVFCYIESKDCYGTISEIELAHTLGIKVVIAFAPGVASPQNNDMWFPCDPAHKIHYDVAELDLQEIFQSTLKELPW
jgi:hypothetical protein